MWGTLANVLIKVLVPLLTLWLHGGAKKHQGKAEVKADAAKKSKELRQEGREIARRVRTDPDYRERVRRELFGK